MIPESFPASRRSELIDPAIMGPPSVYLASDEAKAVNGMRIVATEWEWNDSHATPLLEDE